MKEFFKNLFGNVNKAKVAKVVGPLAMLLGFGLSAAGSWADNIQMEETIKMEVAKALQESAKYHE